MTVNKKSRQCNVKGTSYGFKQHKPLPVMREKPGEYWKL